MSNRLVQSVSVALDGAGNGTVEIDVPYNQRWTINRANVLCGALAPPIPRFVLYRNSAQASNAISGTYTGNQDTAEFPQPEVLEGGEKLVGVWTDGTPADTATLSIAGAMVVL